MECGVQYPGDNGNYWSVKSWMVTLNAGYLVSDEIQLSVGDVIFGNQTRLDDTTWSVAAPFLSPPLSLCSESGCYAWPCVRYVGSTVQSSGATTSITAQGQWLQTQPWAYNTLECYGCTSCQSYPDKSPALFTDIALYSKGQLITPEWIVTPKVCHVLRLWRLHLCSQCRLHALLLSDLFLFVVTAAAAEVLQRSGGGGLGQCRPHQLWQRVDTPSLLTA
jgi:hypothetical protein